MNQVMMDPLNLSGLIATVGAEIASIRKSQSFTVEELSKRSGISMGLISQIERGVGNPSFNTMIQIAHALQVPIARLFHTATTMSPIVRRANRQNLDTNPDIINHALHQLLTPDQEGALEAIWIEAPPGYDTESTPFAHAGEEFGLVLEGTHQIFLDGVCHELGPGDSIRYSSAIPHWYRNPGPELVRAVWVITGHRMHS